MTWILSFAFVSLSTFQKLLWLVGAKTLPLNPTINFFSFSMMTNIMNFYLSTNTTTLQLFVLYNGSFIHLLLTKLYQCQANDEQHFKCNINGFIYHFYYTSLLLQYTNHHCHYDDVLSVQDTNMTIHIFVTVEIE